MDNQTTNSGNTSSSPAVAVQTTDPSMTMARAVLAQSQQKNLGVGIALALFFGPLGLFYSSIIAGIIMLIIDVILLGVIIFVALFTGGLGVIVFFPIQLACNIISVICCIVCINSHNEKIRNEVLSGLR